MTRARALGVARVHRGHVLSGRPQSGHVDGRAARLPVVARHAHLRPVAGGHRTRDVLRQPAAVSGLAVHREPGAGHVRRRTVPGRVRASCETDNRIDRAIVTAENSGAVAPF